MKKLDELGISPTPWTKAGDVVDDNEGRVIFNAYDDDDYANASLIAAAPELYDALRGILEIVCVDCKSSYEIEGKCVKCPRVVAAEAALAKASGEGEERK